MRGNRKLGHTMPSFLLQRIHLNGISGAIIYAKYKATSDSNSGALPADRSSSLVRVMIGDNNSFTQCKSQILL